jgi:hypothetical protein
MITPHKYQIIFLYGIQDSNLNNFILFHKDSDISKFGTIITKKIVIVISIILRAIF